jgi:four helix bundle protein
MKENFLREKSFKFALRIVKLCRYLNDEKQEFVISKQILLTGTSIGASIEEAQQVEDRSDFMSKLAVANKFAFKTNYWLRLLRESNYLTEKEANNILADCDELQSLLVTSLKTTRKNL